MWRRWRGAAGGRPRRRLSPETSAVAAPRRIVLITLDTLRADHLGCYGYPRQISPFLDQLAREGARFANAFAPMATTTPSHASLFTGLYPLEHGVTRNGQVLADSFVTLAEILAASGYRTAAFVGTAHHFGRGNLAQGFALLDEPHLADGAFYRPCEETVERAVQWVRARGTAERWLLWVHLYDPHYPLATKHRLPPARGAEREALLRHLTDGQHVPLGFFAGSADRLLQLMDLYDGEVRALDAQLRRLWEAVKENGEDAGTLWLVVGDHGEGLGNHSWRGHGKMIYNEELRVPLILHLAGSPWRGVVVPEVVELIDVLPTLLSLLSLPAADMPVHLRGRSLLSLLAGEGGAPAPGGRDAVGQRGVASRSGETGRLAFAQRRTFDPDRRPDAGTAAAENYEAGEKYAIQDRFAKLIVRSEGPDELYDLRADPYELDNLVGRGRPEEARLQAALARLLGRLVGPASVGTVDAATQRALRSLGYID